MLWILLILSTRLNFQRKMNQQSKILSGLKPPISVLLIQCDVQAPEVAATLRFQTSPVSLNYTVVIMGTIASQFTSLTVVYSTVYSDADQRKYQSSASLAFLRGIHRRPVNSPHKWPVTRTMFPFDDVIMYSQKPCLGVKANSPTWRLMWIATQSYWQPVFYLIHSLTVNSA